MTHACWSVAASRDGDVFACDGTGHDVFAIRRHVRVVNGALHGEALDPLQRDCINDVHGARRDCYGYVNAASVTADADIVGMAAERDLCDDFECAGVSHIQRAFGFIADVNARPVRSGRRAMIHFDAGDMSDDFVRSRSMMWASSPARSSG